MNTPHRRLQPAASHCQDTLTLHPRVLFARCHNSRALGSEGLLSVLSMSTLQWWRVQHSVPSCQFIYIHCVLWTEVPKQDTMAGECNYFILLRTFVKSNECCQRPLRGWGACWAAPRGPGRCNGSLIAPAPNTVPGSPMTKFAQK